LRRIDDSKRAQAARRQGGRQVIRLLLPAVIAVFMLAAAPAGAEPPAWTAQPADSRITFAGTHAGQGFEGRFAGFSAEIRFDPEAPETAAVTVSIPLAGAATGDPLRDRALPQADWFDTARHPQARFVLRGVRRVSGDAADGRYEADGVLTLRGREVPVPLPFHLRVVDGVARMEAEATLDRLDFGIGAQSDPSAQWVSRQIRLRLVVVARRG
jgi:polyisoprenoid-binding protein YceI